MGDVIQAPFPGGPQRKAPTDPISHTRGIKAGGRGQTRARAPTHAPMDTHAHAPTRTHVEDRKQKTRAQKQRFERTALGAQHSPGSVSCCARGGRACGRGGSAVDCNVQAILGANTCHGRCGQAPQKVAAGVSAEYGAGQAGMHWNWGRYPLPPFQAAQPMPCDCVPGGKCELHWHW